MQLQHTDCLNQNGYNVPYRVHNLFKFDTPNGKWLLMSVMPVLSLLGPQFSNEHMTLFECLLWAPCEHKTPCVESLSHWVHSLKHYLQSHETPHQNLFLSSVAAICVMKPNVFKHSHFAVGHILDVFTQILTKK